MKTSHGPAVCLVGYKYYPEHNHLRRDIEALTQAGYDVSLVALRHPGEAPYEMVAGAHVYRLPIQHQRGSWLRYAWEYALFLFMAFFTVAWLHAWKRFSVVEVVNMPDVLVFSALVPKLTGARVILYIFDNMPELFAVTRRCGASHPIVRILGIAERASARFADRVIVTQEVARRIVQSRGIAPERVSVVLNGPDERVFAREGRPGELPARSSRFEIITHGLLLERFGVHVLIDALPRIAEQIPSVHLKVVGDGEYRGALEARARAVGVAERVDFLDWMPVGSLIEHIRQSDVGYVGMLCDNMLSNKLMEYVALGKPVVLARWRVYEHYFPDDTVSYVRPGDVEGLAEAVVALWRDAALARTHVERAGELYERYRWATQREYYLGIYADLVADRGTRSSPQPSLSSN